MHYKELFTASTLKAQPLRAVSLVRPLIGNLRPALITADDGAHYIVKTWGNGQHPNALANEHLASAICAAVGLPVPASKPIELSKQFLHSVCLSAPNGDCTHRPEPGIHYASPLVLPKSDQAFLIEQLGRNLVGFVENRRDFLGMYILDVCFKHRASRQAVFIKSKRGPASQAIFIDHDQMFGGSNWETANASQNPHHRNTGLYRGLLIKKDVSSWLRMFGAKLHPAVDIAVKHLPSEWYTGDLASFHSWLHYRIQCLPELADQALAQNPIFREYLDATMHLPNTRICQIGT